MTNHPKFGGTFTMAIYDRDGRAREASENDDAETGLYPAIEAAVEEVVQFLKRQAIEAFNFETYYRLNLLDAEDPPGLSTPDFMPDALLVAGNWSELEDVLADDGLILVEFRIPPCERAECTAILKAFRAAGIESFGDGGLLAESGFDDANDVGAGAELVMQSRDFDLMRFACSAPEAQWQELSGAISDFRVPTLRQKIGPALMRDMAILGRESISPHSIRTALSKADLSKGSAVIQDGKDTFQFGHFTNGFILKSVADDYEFPFHKVLDDLVDFCRPRSMQERHDHVHPEMEQMLDRFAVALNWASELEPRLSSKRQISNGALSQEGSSQIVIGLDGEPVLFISEESGWLSVLMEYPDESGHHLIQKCGFSISDAAVAIPLIGLDMAEMTAMDRNRSGLPIISEGFDRAVLDLRDRLDRMGLIRSIEPIECTAAPSFG